MQVKETIQSGWGRALRSKARITRPERRASLDEIISTAPGPAFGAARSYGDAALNADGALIDMSRLDRILDFNPETGRLSAEAGVRLGDLLAIFGPQGWMPAALPGTAHVTLGGAIASDVHGKNHHLHGSFGQHVAAIQLLGADGSLRDISETTDPELFRATIGGMGQTGVILSAELRLIRCAGGQVRLHRQRMADLDAFMDAFDDSEAEYSVGWIDATAKGTALGRGILEEGEIVPGPFRPARKPRSIPFTMPGLTLSRPVVKMFNALYLRRASYQGRTRKRPVQAMFYPLDGLAHWNRLYGKRGFYQFQCVLPQSSCEVSLPQILEEIAESGLASPLSVLKKLGPGRAGYLSFPMAGMTLAADFRARPRAQALIARLHLMVAEAGGRVYLTKDSLLDPKLLPIMYPDIEKFRAVLAEADPEGCFTTDLARRLHLRGGAV